ncbi:MAG: hypothetical protein AAF141_09485 [Pseudomonadota bacterium]
MAFPAKSPLTRTAMAVAFMAIAAAPLTTPVQAQNIDVSVMLPNLDFPQEGAFQSPEAAKKLPRETRGVEFFLSPTGGDVKARAKKFRALAQ